MPYSPPQQQMPHMQQTHYQQQDMYNTGVQFNSPVQPIQQQVPVAKEPEPEKPKAPIPEEHVQIKTTFDELKSQCSINAKNPVSFYCIYL